MSVLYRTNVEESISNKPNASTAFNLAAAAMQADGLRNVLAAYADTEQLPYFISDGAGLWEDGIGTVTGTTLVRSVINESSNSGSAVDFSGGGALTLIVGASARINQGFSFIAAGLTAAISVPSSTFTTLKNWIVVKDDAGWYDSASGAVIPTIPGYYLVTASCNFAASGSTIIMKIVGGLGDGWGARTTNNATTYIGNDVTRLVYCNGTTHTIKAQIYKSSSTQDTFTGSSDVSFSVTRIA